MNATSYTIIFLITTVALFIILVTILNLWPYVIVGGSIAALIFERAMHYRTKRLLQENDMWRTRFHESRATRDALEKRWAELQMNRTFREIPRRTVRSDDRDVAQLRKRVKEEWDRFDGDDLR